MMQYLPTYNAQDEKIKRLEALVHRLIQDPSIGSSLLGPFPLVGSPIGQHRIGDPTELFYPSCTIGPWPTLTSESMTGNTIHASPFYLPQLPNLVNRMAFAVTQAEAGKNVRLGIYDDNGKMYPGRLLKDVGTVSVAATGGKALSVDMSLSRGLKWLTLLTDASILKVRGVGWSVTSSPAGAWAILGAFLSDLREPMCGWWKTGFTYGAMPNPFPSDGIEGDTEPCLFLSFKEGGWS